jgi:Leucine Rich repeat
MAIYDNWHGDDRHYHAEELNFDIAEWPPQADDKRYTLRLEESTEYDVYARLRCIERNLARTENAKKRKDIVHVEVHYSCCIDHFQREAIESLLRYDDRDWISFTMIGINGIGDLYIRPASDENLYSLFLSMSKVKVLNLHSCTSSRGHGLEIILKAIPYFDRLKELRLEGWQMDRVSVAALVESLQFQHKKSVSLLSMRSCLFLGEGAFLEITNGLQNIPQLETLSMSYCNLGDNDIIPLVDSMKIHPSIDRVHLGGNFCRSQDSVSSIAEWIKDPSCNLLDLNVRALWIGFSEEGLVQRYVDLEPLFDALSFNTSLRHLTISENYMEDEDIHQLANALLTSPCRALTFLDVGDNPFKEAGATSLLEVARGVRTLRFIRFENRFAQYHCADLLKLLAEFNRYDSLLLDKSVLIPMALWPFALSQVKAQETEDSMQDEKRSSNLLYWLLQSSTGPFGQHLSIRIALHRKGNH